NIHGGTRDRELARVEPREVEEIGGELRQPLDLAGHLLDEVVAFALLELLVRHQLEKPAQGKERRAQLVRRVGDEFPPGMVELSEAESHAVEGSRELADLVVDRIDHRMLEIAGGDTAGGVLEPADPPREAPGGKSADDEREQE